MSDNINIKEIHPELEPINGAPSLFSFYGCGSRLYGDRDYSEKSRSTVKTLYFSMFYIPLIPLSAYRVVQDGKQFYFLGKVPVSKTAKRASLATTAVGALAILGFGGQQYLSSESYKFGKTLSAAEAAVEDSRYSDAMALYKTVYDDSESYRLKAGAAMGDIMAPTRLKTVSNEELAGVLDTYNSFGVPPLPRMHDAVYDLALERVKTDDRSDPISLHRLINETENLNAKGEDLSEISLELAKTINETDPTNLDAAVEIAEVHFLENDFEQVKALLSPVRAKLGDSEGARMLAQVFIGEGAITEAYPLLSEYTSSRLEVFQEAENRFDEVHTELWDKEFFKLQNGLGPDSFYKQYEEAPESEQQLLVDTYISDIVYNKPKYLDALSLYREASDVVPVAMDFGVLQLRRAEGLTSEEEREAELKSAEETFLSIRNVAGESDEYKIFLGQVYFWLGKQDEGQALFDEILAANDRSSFALVSIATTLRSLGKTGMAKELTQEAYDKSTDDESKFNAANMMYHFSISNEDRVKWLERSDPNAANVQASLKETKGHLAAEKGDTESALLLYREAIQHSERLPENAVTYNNRALIYFSLHSVSGDKEDFKKGAQLMSDAVNLQADDSILLVNAADSLLVKSFYDVLPDTIQFDKMRSRPSMSNLSWYYSDQSEKTVLIENLKQNEDFMKSIEYFERSVLLAPNNADNYDALADIYNLLKDEDSLVKLVARMKKSQIDISTNKNFYNEYVNGKTAEDDLSRMKESAVRIREMMAQKGLNRKTQGALHYSLSNNLQNQVNFGETDKLAAAVQQAKLAVDKLPSSRTENHYISALMTQVGVEAAEQFPEHKTLREEWVKGYGDSSLVTLVLRNGGEVADWLAKNSAFQQALDLERQSMAKFPKSSSSFTWAFFDAVGDPLAKDIAANFEASGLREAMVEKNQILTPYAGNTFAQDLWIREMAGESGLSDEMRSKAESLEAAMPEQFFK